MSVLVDNKIKLNTGSYPTKLLLTLNKAKTVSWRLGVAWTLTSRSGEVLTCNGDLFNKHIVTLINDLKTYSHASVLYISYCPIIEDIHSNALIETLQQSNLLELHVVESQKNTNAVHSLSIKTAIPAFVWPSNKSHSDQAVGIAWVRSRRRPWVHIVCFNSLGGGALPLKTMSEQLGVIPYVTIKGFESSLLYVQNNCGNFFGAKSQIADTRYFETSRAMVKRLKSLSAATVSVVTIVCDPSWLALTIKNGLVNEVSYFLSLRSSNVGHSTMPSIVEFPECDQWVINSSEVRGDFMQVVLQKGLSC